MNNKFNSQAVDAPQKEPYWKVGDTYKFRDELQNGGRGRVYVNKYGLPYEAKLVKEYDYNGKDFIALQSPDGHAFGLSKDVADEVYTNIEPLQLKPVTRQELPGFGIAG